jgi:CelD/BcsL family acetyltransferase involved in cellulose biosynthesis
VAARIARELAASGGTAAARMGHMNAQPLVEPAPRAKNGARTQEDFEPLVLPFRRRDLLPWLSQWKELTKDAGPFVQPAFFFAVAHHLHEGGEPLFAGAVRNGRLVFAMPVLRRDGRMLGPLATLHTPRYDAVGDPRALATVWRGLERHGGWDVMNLERIGEDSLLARHLPDVARDTGGRAVVHSHNRAPWFTLGDLDTRISKKFKTELRRQTKKLGDVRYERISTFDRGALREAFAIEKMSWKGAEGTAIALDPQLSSFYTTIARLAAKAGELTIGFLRLGDKRIAMHFAIERGGVYYLLKPSYDPEFAPFGPGQLMMYHAALDAKARGLASCDLLGRDEAWKMKWTEDVRQHVIVICHRGTALGGARWMLGRARAEAARALRKAKALAAPKAAAHPAASAKDAPQPAQESR